MTHHVRIREEGMWVAGPIDPDEVELIDAQLFGSIDGDTGGDWSPSSPINIGGTQGIELASTTPLTALGPVQIGSSPATALYVDSTSHFYGPVTSSGNLTISAGNLVVSGPGCQIDSATTILNGSTNVNGQFNIKHNATFGNSLSHIFTLLGILDAGVAPPVGYDSGRIRFSLAITQLSGNANFSAKTNVSVTVFTSLNGGSRSITLLHADAGTGDWKLFINKDTTYNITVFDETAGGIAAAVLPGGMCLAFYDATTGRWYGSAVNT